MVARRWILAVGYLWITVNITVQGDTQGHRFRLEFSKPTAYEGEQILANFVLYAEEDALDVEVAKFPEFRGFWSENISLRQGPLPLMRELPMGLFRSASVGRYLIASMVGRRDAQVNPMKLVTRALLSAEKEELILESEISPLTILPLPPLPADIAAHLFRGAVGNLTLHVETPEIRFQKDEPFSLRFSLQGEGNFQELNDLPLPLPDFMEVISRRTYAQGSGPFATKLFEVTAVARSDQNFLLDGIQFVSFSPIEKQYRVQTVPPVRFVFEPKSVGREESEEPSVAFSPPHLQWTQSTPLQKSKIFWALQALVLSTLLSLAARKIAAQKKQRRQTTTSALRHQAQDRALAAWREGRYQDFLAIADTIIASALAAKLGDGVSAQPRSKLFSSLRGSMAPEMVALARRLHAAWEASYSPTPPPATEDLPQTLVQFIEKAA